MNTMLNMPGWIQMPSQVQGSDLPAWLEIEKQKSWEIFQKAGLPTRKHERWKYADISHLEQAQYEAPGKAQPPVSAADINSFRLPGESHLLVLVNGVYFPELSDIKRLPEGAVICSLRNAGKQYEPLLKQYMQNKNTKQHPFLNLNHALFNDGLFLYFPENCQLSAPIHLLSLTVCDKPYVLYPRHCIYLADNSRVSILEEHHSLDDQCCLVNAAADISAGCGSVLDIYKLHQQNENTNHFSNTNLIQLKDSHVSITQFTLSGRFVRDDLNVNLQFSGAYCQTAGFYKLSGENQYVDHHIDIEHAASMTKSEMMYKGIVDNKSRAVFNGRLHVHPGAQKITAQQANHNLLLSNQAEVYSKPELEIYADDVKCRHGATTGQLDQDALFYLRSRGLAYPEAVNLLLQAFSAEVIQLIKNEDIAAHIQARIGENI